MSRPLDYHIHCGGALANTGASVIGMSLCHYVVEVNKVNIKEFQAGECGRETPSGVTLGF